MGKMTEEEIRDWNELCDYVKLEILRYGDDTKFPRHLAIRLKGLARGQFIANNKAKLDGTYTFKEILMTFKFCKFKINTAIMSVEIKDEKHLINLFMNIVDGELNSVRDILRNRKKNEERIDKVEINEGSKIEYKRKSKKVTNSRLKDLI